MCGNMVNNSNGHVAINNGSGPPPPNNPTNNSNKKPPVPQRLGQLSQEHRPIIPSKTMAATMAAAKQQQLQMLQQQQQQNNSSGSTMPNFTNMKNDMGKKSISLFRKKRFMHSGPENLKKVQANKLVKSNKSKNFFMKLHF